MLANLTTVQLLLGTTVLLLFIQYVAERGKIRRFARTIADRERSATSVDLALKVGAAVFSEVRALAGDPCCVRFAPFSALGATPATVLTSGGCCSGKSRLTIVLLHELGIPAWQVTLYHVQGHAQHCLVEALCGNATVLIDPHYNLYFAGADGRPIGLAALRAGQRPTLLTMSDGTRGSYPSGDYYQFEYSNTKTANWTMSSTRRAAYQLLVRITRGRIDEMRQPVLSEWPQVLLAMGMALLLITIQLYAVLFTR